MGVDAHFYFKTTVGPNEIMKALKALGKKNVEFKSTHSPEYVTIIFQSNQKGWDKRTMNFFFASIEDSIGFPANFVSLRSDDESIKIMHQLGKMIGGVVSDHDFDDDAYFYRTPGSGDIRWLLDQFYLKTPNAPVNCDEQVKAFVEYVERDEI